MKEKIWNGMGLWAMGLILFVATTIIIHWMIDFVTWSTLDSGWAQALGSIAALGVAIYVMSKQNTTAAMLASETDLRALLRRAASVSAVVERGHTQTKAVLLNVSNILNGGNLYDISQSFQNGQKVLRELRSTLSSIPLHDLGAYEMVNGVHKMLETLTNFDDAATSWQACPYASSLPGAIALMHELAEIADTAMHAFQSGVAALRNIPRIAL